MKRPLYLLILLAPAFPGCAALHSSSGADGCCGPPVCHRCVAQPKPVKEVVYECKLVPYCEHPLPHPGDCQCCPQCLAAPRFKKVLLKREVEVGCHWECRPQEVPCGCRECGSHGIAVSPDYHP